MITINYNRFTHIYTRHTTALRVWSLFLLMTSLVLVLTGSLLKAETLFSGLSSDVFLYSFHRFAVLSAVCLAIGMAFQIVYEDRRSWMRKLSYVAVALSVIQMMWGGGAAGYLLPHRVLEMQGFVALLFFATTLIMAYVYSREGRLRVLEERAPDTGVLARGGQVLVGLILLESLLWILMANPEFIQSMNLFWEWMAWERYIYELTFTNIVHIGLCFAYVTGQGLVFGTVFFLNHFVQKDFSNQQRYTIPVTSLPILASIWAILQITAFLWWPHPWLYAGISLVGMVLLGTCLLFLLRMETGLSGKAFK